MESLVEMKKKREARVNYAAEVSLAMSMDDLYGVFVCMSLLLGLANATLLLELLYKRWSKNTEHNHAHSVIAATLPTINIEYYQASL